MRRNRERGREAEAYRGVPRERWTKKRGGGWPEKCEESERGRDGRVQG